MKTDQLRNRLEVKLFCSKHPNQELTFSTSSQIGAKSAYEINAKLFINQCEMCELDFIRYRSAVTLVVEQNKQDK